MNKCYNLYKPWIETHDALSAHLPFIIYLLTSSRSAETAQDAEDS